MDITESPAALEVAQLRWEWTYATDTSTPPWTAEENFVAAVAEWMTDGRRSVWVARTAIRPVGMVCLTEYQRMPRPSTRYPACWGYLGHLFVHPAHRGHGIGAALVTAATAVADDRGYSKVMLSPTPASIPLYLRCGFTGDTDTMIRTPTTNSAPTVRSGEPGRGNPQ
ncbi:GNAT family N-acetyltransferase [Gordonia sp. OPL2]|uniref:GNAT family N-acetyltransferase n=1 Tax=Gordonia sp. OPL2 TaxID=2486274 RepID=UPI001654C961|nr:GNAT family N-acetyltransferase [Gordonia sp. OPL2]ROZ88076.1 GNAT family N-acetyltransferase [Gordonia sp. OPL2]